MGSRIADIPSPPGMYRLHPAPPPSLRRCQSPPAHAEPLGAARSPPRQAVPKTPGLGKAGKRISTRQPLEVIDALAGNAGALVPFVAAAAGALPGAPG